MNSNALYFTLGRPFSPLYSVAMRLRELGYRRGLFRSYSLDAPVISVGNLTLGGTGKTPMVQYLARLLQGKGYRPAVISRGWGGAVKNRVNLVSDGEQLYLDARQAGDEPRLLAETLPGVPVLTGVVRRLPAEEAIAMGADILLLDDGFQHLQVRRDLNLVLFSADRLAGNSRVFPGGELREPVAALRRAGRFVLTGVRADNRQRAEQFADLLGRRFPGIGVSLTGYAAIGAVTPEPGGLLTDFPLEALRERTIFAFCGIGRPNSFRRTLEGLGLPLADFVAFNDHQPYPQATVISLLARARRVGADTLVVTEKDLVKLKASLSSIDLPLVAVRMQVEADPTFEQWILEGVRNWNRPAAH